MTFILCVRRELMTGANNCTTTVKNVGIKVELVTKNNAQISTNVMKNAQHTHPQAHGCHNETVWFGALIRRCGLQRVIGERGITKDNIRAYQLGLNTRWPSLYCLTVRPVAISRMAGEISACFRLSLLCACSSTFACARMSKALFRRAFAQTTSCVSSVIVHILALALHCTRLTGVFHKRAQWWVSAPTVHGRIASWGRVGSRQVKLKNNYWASLHNIEKITMNLKIVGVGVGFGISSSSTFLHFCDFSKYIFVSCIFDNKLQGGQFSHISWQ